MTLYEFQQNTLNNLQQAQQNKPIVVLNSEEGTGKSTILQSLNKLVIRGNDYTVIKCTGSADKTFVDYGCLPSGLLNEVKKKISRKSLGNSLILDFLGTISNIAFVQSEKSIGSLLSKNEEEDLEQIVDILIKKSNHKPLLFVFDALSNLDYKSCALFYTIMMGIKEARINNIRIIVAVDTEEAEFVQLKSLEQKCLCWIRTDLPTNADLQHIIDPSLVEIGRTIPLKALHEIGNDIEDIHHYLKIQLGKNVQNCVLAEIILLTMAIFESPMTFSDIAMLTCNFDDCEIYQTLNTLTSMGLISRQSDGYDDHYKISAVYRTTLMKHIPNYLVANKLQIYITRLENIADFRYFQKFHAYKKIEATENAYVNALLAYCSYARGSLVLSNEELSTVKLFLENWYDPSLFKVIEKGYSFYCKEQYEDCYIMLISYLESSNFVINETIQCYSYPIEFVIELVYLSALGALRVAKITHEQLKQEQQYIKLSIEKIEHIKNVEFTLRLKELLLLIEVDLGSESDSYYCNCYFQISSVYTDKIRTLNIESQMQWETRYAMHLLRINSISGVPNKLSIIHDGFEKSKKYREQFPKLYLRAACNYACDILWRGLYEESYEALFDAVKFIKENHIVSHWGILVQMYTFAALFAHKKNIGVLLEDYNKLVWNDAATRERMHEPYLCVSNYAMLLAANGAYNDAYKLIFDAQTKCPTDKLYEQFILTTNLSALEYMNGNVEKAIQLEEKCCRMTETGKIPNFSKPFLPKRNAILMACYQERRPIAQIDLPLEPKQVLATGYCSDNYTRLMLFSDINYWAN